jgi:hypothetical protein
MLSRVADSLYWMSRYHERAEHTAARERKPVLTLDRAPVDAAQHWGRLLAGLRMPPSMPSSDLAAHATGRCWTSRTATPSPRRSRRPRECATGSTDLFEMWQQINRLFLSVRRARRIQAGPATRTTF